MASAAAYKYPGLVQEGKRQDRVDVQWVIEPERHGLMITTSGPLKGTRG